MRRTRLLLWPAGIVLGLLAERLAQKPPWSVQHHLIDLAVGWIFIACGLLSTDRRPESRSGALMAATGFTWFLGNFYYSDIGAIAWVSQRTGYLYLGFLAHLLLTYPTGKPSSRSTRAAVVVGYIAALATRAWDFDLTWIVLAVFLASISAWDFARSVGRSRRARLLALRVTILVGTVMAGGAIARLVVPESNAVDPSFWLYESTLCAAALILFGGLVWTPWERSAVTDLVVELGEARSGTLRDELSRALGDPSLEVGYWFPDPGRFVDAEGKPLSLPDHDPHRSVTTLKHNDRPIAALVHDPAVLDDPGLLEAVSSATQLAASNAQLQAEVRSQVVELKASRRRVLEAGDEERRRLERRLHDGAEHSLDQLGETLRAVRADAPGVRTRERIDRAEDQLQLTLEELARLGQGLHPRELSERGFAGAIEALAGRCSVPVAVSVTDDEIPRRIAAAAYFVCSEALANVTKYAAATRASISAPSSRDRLTLTIEDDGVGGADPTKGSGLVGLADRVEALGGTLRVEGPQGHGTRVVAEIPFGDEPPDRVSQS